MKYTRENGEQRATDPFVSSIAKLLKTTAYNSMANNRSPTYLSVI